jgi:predicted 3-demethylubiquinone-9 3-methyltransferase (glyoxalase superfamily)
MAMAKNTICVWYDKEAEAAARFYAPPARRAT